VFIVKTTAIIAAILAVFDSRLNADQVLWLNLTVGSHLTPSFFFFF